MTFWSVFEAVCLPLVVIICVISFIKVAVFRSDSTEVYGNLEAHVSFVM